MVISPGKAAPFQHRKHFPHWADTCAKGRVKRGFIACRVRQMYRYDVLIERFKQCNRIHAASRGICVIEIQANTAAMQPPCQGQKHVNIM